MEDMNETRSPVVQDATIEAAVMRQLLALYPVQMTVDELAREIGGQSADFAETDAVERAVNELDGRRPNSSQRRRRDPQPSRPAPRRAAGLSSTRRGLYGLYKTGETDCRSRFKLSRGRADGGEPRSNRFG